ncbi:YtxH domain-containing protein [Candidatus Protochlamydia phocaeensis]|uniref:YtxH domain-containing protein n=1 Tax=Candidatus Protochlamydia phocaeensis TaxID=1414722 RepID=UPI0008396E26|nr:YtxH domain-containing protein [Candidatus Protochlamydia phocaeensis]
MTNHINSKEFLVGAAVGSLLGGVAALLTAPKSGKRLRGDINNMYCDLSDRTQDVAQQVSKRGKSLAKSMSSQTCDWADKAKCIVSGVKNWVGLEEEEEEETTRDLLIGGLVGGILGATAGLLLAPKAGSELREDLADAYNDVSDRTQDMAEEIAKKGKSFAKTARSRTNKWLELAREVVDEISGQVQEKGEDFTDTAKDRLNDIMDWAALGMRVWKGINSKR